MAKKASAGFGSITVNAETTRGEIFTCVQRAGHRGLTCDEIERRLYLPHQTASARVRELASSRVLVETGETRFTRHGRKARVYRVSPIVFVVSSDKADTDATPAHASQAW